MRLDDKIALKKLRELIDGALALGNVAEILGLSSIRATNIRYESNGLSAKITLEAATKSADGKSKDEVNFEQYAKLFDLKPEWLNTTIRRGLDEVKIVGLMPNRSKYPVLVESKETGKRFLITAEEVQRKLNGVAL